MRGSIYRTPPDSDMVNYHHHNSNGSQNIYISFTFHSITYF